MKTPEHTEEDPDDPQPADEVDIQMEYSYDYTYSPSIRTVTKSNCKNSAQYRYHVTVWNIQ